MPQQSGLTIRQHERQSLDLPVEFVVVEAHRAQVRFSAAAAAKEQYVLGGKMTDVSSGGMGLTMCVYVPRMCEARVRVFDPAGYDEGDPEKSAKAIVFEHVIKVRRVFMSSHDPTYGVGVSFVDPASDLEESIRIMQDLGLAAITSRVESVESDATVVAPEAGGGPDA